MIGESLTTPDKIGQAMHYPMLISRATRRFGGVVLLARCLLLSALILPSTEARSEGCPTAKDEIATDRPDVTNSSLVVPTGSLQNENGVNFSMREDGRSIDGPTSDGGWA